MTLPSKFLTAIIATFSFIIGFKSLSFPLDLKVILLTSDRGLLVSGDNGRSWLDFNSGLPENLVPVKIRNDNSGNLYLLTQNSGIYKLNLKNNIWEDMNSKEFLDPFASNKGKYRSISAFTADENGTLALATRYNVFRKERGGHWIKVAACKEDNYYTALGLNKNIYAGTSYNGLLRISGSGIVDISSGLPREQYSKDYFVYEEIAEIMFGKKDPNIIYCGLNFGGGLYVSKDRGGSWKPVRLPIAQGSLFDIFDLKISGDSIFVSATPGIYTMTEDNKWDVLPVKEIIKMSSKSGDLAVFIMDKSGKYPPLFYRFDNFHTNDSAFKRKAGNRKAIYANFYSLNKNFAYYIDTIKKCGLNAVVIDMKDDWGDICFPSRNKTALEIGAVKRYADTGRLMDILKKNGIYTIARIVVFKDKRLFDAYDSKYAVWDAKNHSPWRGNPKEYWNDPYSDFVRNYNIEIAVELEGLGFDEIQFDYIRFPSDGPIGRCYYRYRTNKNIYKSEILACFLEEAKSRINIPVSVDVYGFSTWFRMGDTIGQDAERFSEIADVICPMVYPSHYGRNFFQDIPAGIRPYQIVLESAMRAKKITIGNVVIRPYLQAFDLLSPTWGPDYISSQIKAVNETGCGGYTLWNAGGNYDMLRKAVEGGSPRLRSESE